MNSYPLETSNGPHASGSIVPSADFLVLTLIPSHLVKESSRSQPVKVPDTISSSIYHPLTRPAGTGPNRSPGARNLQQILRKLKLRESIHLRRLDVLVNVRAMTPLKENIIAHLYAQNFVTPLSADPWASRFKEGEFDAIFRNVDEIRELHQRVRDTVQEYEAQWTDDGGLDFLVKLLHDIVILARYIICLFYPSDFPCRSMI